MDKIVGNTGKQYWHGALWTIFVCAFVCAAPDHVSLTLLSSDGEPIEQIAAGAPFQLAVTVPDCKNTGVRPKIAGLEHFVQRSSGFSMTTINGKSTTKYVYTLSCDTPGTYLVGPARVMIDGDTVQSDSVRVVIDDRTVSMQQNQQASAGNSQNQSTYFLRVSLDKEQAFVGEPVMCAVRLYAARDGVSVKNITKPSLPGFEQREHVQERSGTEQLHGTRYGYHEWRWVLVPREVGKKIIPAFCADIEQPNSFHSLFAHMAAFMQFPGEHARLYSNALTLQVDPLPAHTGVIHLVGAVDAVQVAVDPAVAKEGEGIVLNVRITGDGDLESLDSFALQQMPEQLKWYDSKNYTSPAGSAGQEKPAKIFEYIVQGLTPGEYEIPAQTCTSFDVHTKTYVSVTSSPVRVTICANPGSISRGCDSSVAVAGGALTGAVGTGTAGTGAQQSSAESSVATSLALGAILPLNTEGVWYAQEKRSIPWFVFYGFLGVLVLLGAVRVWRLIVARLQKTYAAHNKKKQAIRLAHAALYKLAHVHACAGVYPVFITVFSVLLDTPESSIHDLLIENALAKTSVTAEQIHAWQQFFSRAAEFSFYASEVTESEQEKFFKAAHAWLDLLSVRLGEKQP